MPKPILMPSLTAETSLDRLSAKRSDQDYISSLFNHKNAKILQLHDLKLPILSTDDRSSAFLAWISNAEFRDIHSHIDIVFLGRDRHGYPYFTCETKSWPDDLKSAQHPRTNVFVTLRSIALQGVLNSKELLIASQAHALLGWHNISQFCGRCGGKTVMMDAGWSRRCISCDLSVYPRMDPVVIMLVTHEDRCLLGHEPRFPENFYSALAGFVEAGDDIENAVRREVKEETAIEVGKVRYVGSQPWPFPHSLMIGCWGEGLTQDIVIDPTEIVDARWFHRHEALSMLEERHPQSLTIPSSISMAHTLIKAFIDETIPN